jgi:ABC-type uncharacterized transport system auxiliary subunit
MSKLRCVLLSLGLAVSGCSNLLHSTAPALQLYVLPPPGLESPAVSGGAPLTAAPASLRVARPLPGPGLNTDRIALLLTDNRLDYYAGSRWSAPLPDLVAELELATFHNDAALSAVADDRSSFNADYLLQTSIEQFSAVYATAADAPLISVTLHCVLIRRSDGALLGSFAVSERQQAQENRMASVVAAFSAAADRAIIAVAAHTDALLRSAKSPAAP